MVLIAGISLYILWVRDDIFVTSLIGLSFNSSFVVAYFTAPVYGGVLAEDATEIFSLMDIPPNLAENATLGLIFLGIAIYQRKNNLKLDNKLT